MFTARGLTGWRDDRVEADTPCAARVILGTIDARLIAIDARTGSPCSDFGQQGQVDLTVGIKNYRRGEYSLTSPPAVIGDVVVVGSSVGDNGAVELDHGVVRGFDARNGSLLWAWDPIPRSNQDPGFADWTAEGAKRTGAANVWSLISGDPASGIVYLPTTSPSPDFYGGKRPGNNRYANSLVALDSRSGRFRWGFQTVHHDLWDFDLASQPTVTHAGPRGRPAVVLPTKMGHVFVLDSDNGEPLFAVEEIPVPASDVPGEQASPTQPVPTMPRDLHPRTVSPDDAWGLTEAQANTCREMISRYRWEGLYTPPSLQGSLLYPGNFGGTNWGSAAVDEKRRIAVMAINRMATVVALVPRRQFRKRSRKESGGPMDIQFTSQSGTPFGMMRFNLLHPEARLPCLRGPWGTLVSVDLDSGEKRWETPIGSESGTENSEASAWGSILVGGPMLTAGGLTFVATRSDATLYALDSDDGRIVARLKLPAGAHATPMSYQHQGRQYVAIAAGGRQADGGPGDYLNVFALEPAASKH